MSDLPGAALDGAALRANQFSVVCGRARARAAFWSLVLVTHIYEPVLCRIHVVWQSYK